MVREMRLADDAKVEYTAGDTLDVKAFAETKWVDVIGTSKGKGFAGVMKRHRFRRYAGFARYRAQAPFTRFDMQLRQRPRSWRKP